jgi:basic amino acid/polyamine antiporter, APA family
MTDGSLPDRKLTTLPRVLGPAAAFCIVVGSTIGSGIFMVPATVAKNVPYMSGILLVWLVGGLLSGAGALTLAELGAMMPRAGGLYVFLRAAYGALPAFLFGWVEFLVVRSGSMATLAAAFARYFAQLAPAPAAIGGELWQAGAAVAAIGVVTAVNVLGTRFGGALQVLGTALKLGGLALLFALPLVLGGGSISNLTPVWPSAGAGGSSLFAGMMTAMVGVLWAYDGWTNVTPVAEEIRDPGRNVPRALLWGTAVIISVYVGMTLAYHYVMPMTEVAAGSRSDVTSAVAAQYCKQLVGRPGVVAISMLVMCSTFISLNGNALSGPRAYFAMARDGLFPGALCRIHPRFQTPANAVLAQGIWAIILTVVGTALVVVPPPAAGTSLPGPLVVAWAQLNKTPLYDILFTYVIFGANLFYMLAISSVFVLRVRRPELPRPYRTIGYPITPLLYVAGVLILLGSMLADYQSRVQALAGLGIIALGVPAFWVFRRRPPEAADNTGQG